MNEAKKTTLGILFLYITSTTIFLSIIFGMWYGGELSLLKTHSFHEAKALSKELIAVLAKREKYGVFIQSPEGQKAILQSLSLQSGYPLAAFDQNGELIYSNLGLSLTSIPQENGVYLINDHVILNSYGPIDFLNKNSHSQNNASKHIHDLKAAHHFRIILDGGNVGYLLWKLRIKIWGIFGILLIMIAIIGGILVRLALKPLNQKIQELDLFIKDTTHEINTPLSVLQMSVNQIDQNLLQDKDRKAFHSIQMAAKTLEGIYRSLIYAVFGQLENKIQTLELSALLQERLEYFEMLFNQKKFILSTDLQEVFLQANLQSMTLVIDNLLSNAYKYTPKHGKIEIKTWKKNQDCFLLIKDNGYGIPPQNLERIFERYSRFDESKGGFGVGLNIVQKICQEFKITITAKSELKKGTEFLLQWRF